MLWGSCCEPAHHAGDLLMVGQAQDNKQALVLPVVWGPHQWSWNAHPTGKKGPQYFLSHSPPDTDRKGTMAEAGLWAVLGEGRADSQGFP